MELPVSAQALQFAQAAVLALALCAGYDALRAVRQRVPRTSAVCDVLFGLAVCAALLLFALTAGGGQFRLYVFAALLLTAVLYFLTLSRVLLRLFQAILAWIGKILHILLAPLRFLRKKLKIFLETLFASCRKWVTMTNKVFLDWKHAQLERRRRRNEICQVVSRGQAGDSDPRCVRHRYPGAPARADQRQGRRGQRPHKRHRQHAAGE